MPTAELEDELKQRDRRINELKADVTRLEDIVTRQSEHVQACSDLFDEWIRVFHMTLNDDGKLTWAEWVDGCEQWYDKWEGLRKQWNRVADQFNATVLSRNVGRPLAASDAQSQQVLGLHKSGMSLRCIADETSLGLRTVRTIIEQSNRTDHTSCKLFERIKPERERKRAWMAKRRTRDALPRRIQAARETCDELIKEAKGLGR